MIHDFRCTICDFQVKSIVNRKSQIVNNRQSKTYP